MKTNCTKELHIGCANNDTGDVVIQPEDEPKSLDFQAIKSFNNLICLKRGMSMLKLYEGHTEEDNSDSAKEVAVPEIELVNPFLAAEVSCG